VKHGSVRKTHQGARHLHALLPGASRRREGDRRAAVRGSGDGGPRVLKAVVRGRATRGRAARGVGRRP
jgi:hypothetical protein